MTLNPSAMTESDIFAAYILAYTALGRFPKESAFHTKGCRGMLKLWHENIECRFQSDLLDSFEPLIRNWINFYHKIEYR
jgi:hypothetical protein